jgi:ABC-type cobalamin/Fe3+-siderophores transport system ATPase subunit
VIECEAGLLPAREVTALVGSTESGKSTLLKTLADQLSPGFGQVVLNGEAGPPVAPNVRWTSEPQTNLLTPLV